MKILIIGLGSIAKKHIITLQKINKNFKFIALRNSNKSINIPGIRSIYTWEEIDFIPYFIIISNPTSEHFKTIERAINYKCPLFIEKPSLSNIVNANFLLQNIITSKTITYIGCDLRFHPALLKFKNIIKNIKNINEVNIYCGSNLKLWRKNVYYKDTYSAKIELGGGVHLDLYHEFDYCFWLFGTPNKITKVLTSKSSLDINSFDYANYILEYETFNISIILNYYRTDIKREIEVVSEDATLKVDLVNGIISESNTNIIQVENKNIEDIYIDQMQYFINCIDLNKDTFNNLKTSLEVLNIIFNNET